jgi:hypothetical protein
MATVAAARLTERRALAASWFDEADDFDRLLFINDMLARARDPQLAHLRRYLITQTGAPPLPRRVLLTVFRFLDPRSLSRAAQVRKRI